MSPISITTMEMASEVVEMLQNILIVDERQGVVEISTISEAILGAPSVR